MIDKSLNQSGNDIAKSYKDDRADEEKLISNQKENSSSLFDAAKAASVMEQESSLYSQAGNYFKAASAVVGNRALEDMSEDIPENIYASEPDYEKMKPLKTNAYMV